MRTKIRLRHIWLLLVLTMLATQIAQAGGDRYPLFVDCPDFITGSHCDSFFAQVRAEVPGQNHPNNANIRYHLITGPGEIDERTGWWRWKYEPSDLTGFHVSSNRSWLNRIRNSRKKVLEKVTMNEWEYTGNVNSWINEILGRTPITPFHFLNQ